MIFHFFTSNSTDKMHLNLSTYLPHDNNINNDVMYFISTNVLKQIKYNAQISGVHEKGSS